MDEALLMEEQRRKRREERLYAPSLSLSLSLREPLSSSLLTPAELSAQRAFVCVHVRFHQLSAENSGGNSSL